MMEDVDNISESPAVLERNHQKMVEDLTKDPAEIMLTLTHKRVDLLHMALGIATEANEILDAVKAHVIYNKPLDEENITEELGDMEFFLHGLRRNVGIYRTAALQHNLAKLAKRYKGKYSDKAAVDRADKKETGETDNKVL